MVPRSSHITVYRGGGSHKFIGYLRWATVLLSGVGAQADRPGDPTGKAKKSGSSGSSSSSAASSSSSSSSDDGDRDRTTSAIPIIPSARAGGTPHVLDYAFDIPDRIVIDRASTSAVIEDRSDPRVYKFPVVAERQRGDGI